MTTCFFFFIFLWPERQLWVGTETLLLNCRCNVTVASSSCCHDGMGMDPLTVGQNKPLTFTRLVRVPYHGNRKISSDSVQSSLLLSCHTEPTVPCKFWVPSLLLSGSSPGQGSTFLFHLHHVSQVTPPLDIPYHPSYAAVSLHNDITTVGTEVLLSASLVTSL